MRLYVILQVLERVNYYVFVDYQALNLLDVGSININGLVPDVYPRNITTLIGTLALSSEAPVITNVVSRLVTGSATIQGVAPIISDPNWIIIDTDQTPDWKEI